MSTLGARVGATLAAAVLSAGLIAPAETTAAENPGQKQCPRTVVFVARGSDQNKPEQDIAPRHTAAGFSNGYEGENLRHLVDRVQWGPGTQVIPLTAEEYPADMSLPVLFDDEDEAAELSSALGRVAGVVQQRPPEGFLAKSWNATKQSVERGSTALIDQVDRIEESGCTPNYVVIGYSQGAVIAQMQERLLRERTQGRLRGVVYVGNPLLRPGETRVGGAPGNGALAALTGVRIPGVPAMEAAWDVPRLNYCVPGDFVCDASLAHSINALANASGVHAEYFVQPRPTDDIVISQLEEWTS